MPRTWSVIAALALMMPLVPAAAVASPPMAARAPVVAADLGSLGVPDGTTLTAMPGGTVRTANTTISNRLIAGNVEFTGSNLTLRNVRVTGRATFRGDNLAIQDSDLGALYLSGTAGVRANGLNISGSTGRDGIHISSDTGRVSDVVIEDTWIHNPILTPTSHYDGIQVRGVDRLTLRRVTVELGPWEPMHNAALFLEGANGGNRDITVEDSTLLGGGYTFYSNAIEVRVRRTVFGGGRWGALYPHSRVLEIREFSGNTSPTGSALPLGSLHPDGDAPRPAMPADQIVASPDFTGNRLGDVFAVDTNGRLFLFEGDGGGRVALARVLGSGWGGLRVYAPGDWNGDRRADLVGVDAKGDLWLYPGNGRGGFGTKKQIGNGWTNFRIVPAGDVDGDGRADLLAIDSAHRLWLYPGNGVGGFGKRVQVGNGWKGFELYAAGDMNRDGRVDILSIDTAGRLWFYAGRGGGYFSQKVQVGNGWLGYAFASGADVNGDKINDLVGRDATGRLWFYAGRVGGTFAMRQQIGSGW